MICENILEEAKELVKGDRQKSMVINLLIMRTLLHYGQFPPQKNYTSRCSDVHGFS